ncbi:Trp biosynthesis-associated membrane protein [Salininema proteolyticum]|uniref:Trp biosynthesis-associated membrane protein n=1 Tax=Salininema proteolyticum TaxID=1607685 RepID=A0ABV8TY00_9ACTN
MSPGRAKGISVLAGLAFNGAAALIAGQDWTSEMVTDDFGLAEKTASTGTDYAPWIMPAALVAGAAFLVLLTLKGTASRRAAALLAAAMSAAAGAGAALHLDAGLWSALTLACAVIAVAAAVLAWTSAPSWPAGGSRYDRSEAAGAGEPSALWDALDSGQDPTSPNIAAKADPTDSDEKGTTP